MQTENQYLAMAEAARHPLAKLGYSIAAIHARDYTKAMASADCTPAAADSFDGRTLDRSLIQGPMVTREWYLRLADGDRRNADVAEMVADGWERQYNRLYPAAV